jgi:hypothetical protein
MQPPRQTLAARTFVFASRSALRTAITISSARAMAMASIAKAP